MQTTEDNAFPTLGILGGGQLGKMMAQAAVRMGVNVRFLAPKPAGPMQFFSDYRVDDWRDADVLRSFAEPCTAVTVESEWAPAAEMEEVRPRGTALWPKPHTLDLIRHKGIQKTHLQKAGLPVPSFERCATIEEARGACEALGYPVVFKQYMGSYDGYGNATVESEDDVEEAWSDLADDDGLLVEAFVPFERELSVIVARRPGGQDVVYPVAYTEQRNHRCHAVVVPAALNDDVAREARRVGRAAVEAVEGVGVTAVELFETEEGDILINELAPRPHNTGHYSIEGCHTSQFENHVRAVLDWPLGNPELRAPTAVMVNVLGKRQGSPPQTKGVNEALSHPDASVHVYGKPDVRPHRKMGHVTVTGQDRGKVREQAESAAANIRL